MTDRIPQPEEISLSPSKDTYDAVQSDVTPISAIKELIDNSIDNWERVYDKNKDLIVEINYDFDQDIFSIEDNSGGLEEANIEKLFALGQTTKSEIDTPIGAYGVGAKKAIVKIGETAELISRYKDQEFGYGYTIDQSWLEDSDTWNVTKEAYDDIKPGRTKIKISNLKLNVGEITVGDDEDLIGEESSFSSEDFFSRVKSNLSNTYEEFLKSNEGFSGELIIKFNGEKIKEPSHREWSYTPFDDFYPRIYENITLKRHNLDSPVYLDIAVGLTREGNQDLAGTDIFCQNRKIIANNDGTVGGFGRDDLNIGVLSATNSRLRARMYFRTEGNADRLPWDTQKNGIDEYDSLMQEAYEWFEKIVYPYWQASSYNNMSQHPVKPYGPNAEQAANNGTMKRFQYKDRVRLSDRPNDDFEDVEDLNKTLKNHLDLGISAPQLVSPEFRPAYKSAIENADQSTVEISDIPTELSDPEIRDNLQKVRKLAREDVDAGVQRQTKNWWRPVYDAVITEQVDNKQELKKIGESETQNIEHIGESNSTQSNTDKKDSENSQQSRLNSENSYSNSNNGGTGEKDTAEGKNTSGKQPNSSEVENHGKSNNSSSTKSSSERGSVDQEKEGQVTESKEETESNQKEQTRSSQNSTSSQGPDSPTGYKETDGDLQPVAMAFSPENKKRLCEYLDLPSDVGRDQFTQSLKEAIISEMVEN